MQRICVHRDFCHRTRVWQTSSSNALSELWAVVCVLPYFYSACHTDTVLRNTFAEVPARQNCLPDTLYRTMKRIFSMKDEALVTALAQASFVLDSTRSLPPAARLSSSTYLIHTMMQSAITLRGCARFAYLRGHACSYTKHIFYLLKSLLLLRARRRCRHENFSHVIC